MIAGGVGGADAFVEDDILIAAPPLQVEKKRDDEEGTDGVARASNPGELEVSTRKDVVVLAAEDSDTRNFISSEFAIKGQG